jgi:hypothetical protein
MNTDIKVGHRSFSAFNSWLRCGKAYQLERILKAPSDPAWWFVGGSAFHSAAEKYLLDLYAKSQVPVETYPF